MNAGFFHTYCHVRYVARINHESRGRVAPALEGLVMYSGNADMTKLFYVVMTRVATGNGTKIRLELNRFSNQSFQLHHNSHVVV